MVPQDQALERRQSKLSEEFQRLQASMRDKAGDRTAESISNLRQQLTEYHSVLDRLGSLSAKHATLEKEFDKRGSRIRSLEAEVMALKMENTRVAGDFMPMSMEQQQQQPQQQQQQQQQQMQDLPNPAMFQFWPGVSSFANRFQASDLISTPSSRFPQSKCLLARHNVSPSPSACRKFPSEGGFRPGHRFPSSGRTVFHRAGGPSLPPLAPKRPILGDCRSVIGTMTPPRQPGAKRLRSNDFASRQDSVRMSERDTFPSPGTRGPCARSRVK